MTQQQIREVVVQNLRRIAPEIDPEQIDPTGDLREQADLDSVDFLNLILSLNKELGVEIPESDYAQLSTLDQCVQYLGSRTGAPM